MGEGTFLPLLPAQDEAACLLHVQHTEVPLLPIRPPILLLIQLDGALVASLPSAGHRDDSPLQVLPPPRGCFYQGTFDEYSAVIITVRERT
jgi:hypothetical protein